MKKISVCIPTYEMKGKGASFLAYSFTVLAKQTFKDFDVVISDHSKDNSIKLICDEYQKVLDIHYYKNDVAIGNSSANTNNAISKATGELIKILFQDDFLYGNEALEQIVNNFDLEKDTWLITACTHTKDGDVFANEHHPTYNHAIHLGKNTISSPSVLTIKNKQPLFFDEKLIWLMDVEYYKRCYDTFGNPKIIDAVLVVNRLGDHQITNTMATIKLQSAEYNYVLRKYEKGLRYFFYLIKGKIIFMIKNSI